MERHSTGPSAEPQTEGRQGRRSALPSVGGHGRKGTPDLLHARDGRGAE